MRNHSFCLLQQDLWQSGDVSFTASITPNTDLATRLSRNHGNDKQHVYLANVHSNQIKEETYGNNDMKLEINSHIDRAKHGETFHGDNSAKQPSTAKVLFLTYSRSGYVFF